MLELIDCSGKVIRTYHYGLSPEKLMKKRNSLQAYWDKYYPDLGYHVRVVEIVNVPDPVKCFVYTELGQFFKECSLAEAKKLVSEHDDWTYWIFQ